jgi:hypothetical protein
MMNTPRILASVIVALLLIAGITNAQVAPPITVTFDEFGVGTIQNGAATMPLPLAAGPPPDPFLTSFDAPTPIVYDLTSLGSVTSGDIEIFEGPIGPTSLNSDLLRFFENRLYVYSDVSASDLADAPADVGIPSVLQNNTALVFSEMGPETGPNGLFGYKPSPGQAGFTPGFAVTYNFTSDYAPEPASLPLITLCTMAPLMRCRRQVVGGH